MGFWKTIKVEAKQQMRKQKELRTIRSKALHEARKKQAVVYGRKKAAMETRARLAPKKTGDILAAIAGDTGKKRKGIMLANINKIL